MGIISQLQALYDYMDGKLTLDEVLSNMRDGGTFMTDIEIKKLLHSSPRWNVISFEQADAD